MTCHDGFTLNDLVSYDVKHNEANRENNRDGTDDNRSWNCGVEGPTEEPPIDTLRTRQVKNFLAVAMLAPGMPMLLMGDEVRRTQRGNNNAYCQDNEISWFDWTLVEPRAEVLRFVRLLNASRVLRDLDHERRRVALNDLIHEAELVWHGVKLDRPDWSATSHSVAFTARFLGAQAWCHVILNAYWEALDFELPGTTGGSTADGSAGSTRSSRLPTTSSSGGGRPWWTGFAIARSRARWWCSSPRPDRGVRRRAARRSAEREVGRPGQGRRGSTWLLGPGQDAGPGVATLQLEPRSTAKRRTSLLS